MMNNERNKLTPGERAVLLEISLDPQWFGQEKVSAVEGLAQKGLVVVTDRNASSMSVGIADIACRLTDKGRAEQQRLREAK